MKLHMTTNKCEQPLFLFICLYTQLLLYHLLYQILHHLLLSFLFLQNKVIETKTIKWKEKEFIKVDCNGISKKKNTES